MNYLLKMKDDMEVVDAAAGRLHGGSQPAAAAADEFAASRAEYARCARPASLHSPPGWPASRSTRLFRCREISPLIAANCVGLRLSTTTTTTTTTGW